jgi:hypothetical protein
VREEWAHDLLQVAAMARRHRLQEVKESAMSALRTHLTLLAFAALLSGCYIVPVRGPDGSVVYEPYALPPAGTPMTLPAPGTGPAAAGQMPAVLTARLYPSNEQAAQTGMVTGTVTNMMTGKGRFQVNYMGEVLSGEATRVSNEDRRGVANAFSPRGTYMSCDYQMTTPYQGTGDCRFSNGATYTMHLGGN